MSITSRIDAITHTPKDSEILAAPKSVKIELTARCNYNCSFCAHSQKLREFGDMDRDLYRRLTSEMRESGVEELGLFFLGESFMLPWLPDAITHAKAIGFPYVFLTTNGSLASPKRVEECMNAGLDSLKWSFNYATSEQMHDIAGVKKSYFGRVLNNIQSAHEVREKTGYRCGLYASYIQYDGIQAERMADAIKKIEPYVDEIYALPLYNQASYVTEQEKARGWKPIPGNVGRVGNPTDPLPCWSLWEGHISYTGELSACCFSHDSRFTMADLRDTHFMEGWNSEKFQELRRKHISKDVTGSVCERCVIYE